MLGFNLDAGHVLRNNILGDLNDTVRSDVITRPGRTRISRRRLENVTGRREAVDLTLVKIIDRAGPFGLLKYHFQKTGRRHLRKSSNKETFNKLKKIVAFQRILRFKILLEFDISKVNKIRYLECTARLHEKE